MKCHPSVGGLSVPVCVCVCCNESRGLADLAHNSQIKGQRRREMQRKPILREEANLPIILFSASYSPIRRWIYRPRMNQAQDESGPFYIKI